MRQLLLLLILLHVSFTTLLFATENPAPAQEVSEVKKSVEIQKEFIQLSDVPEQAVKTLLELKKITLLLTEEDRAYEIHSALPAYSKSIDALLNDKVYQDLEGESIRTLQKMSADWNVYLKQLNEWEKRYKERIVVYDTNREKLENYSLLWSETHINSNKEQAPQAIQDHVTSVIIEIEKLRNHAKSFYDEILIGSNIITTKILLINEALLLIKETETMLSNRVFYQNEFSYLDALELESFSPIKYLLSAYTSAKEKVQEANIYFKSDASKLWYLLLSIVLNAAFIAYFNYLYRKKKLFIRKESLHKKTFFFIGRPFSTFFILIVLCNVVIFPEVPKSVTEFELFIILIPIFRILLTVIPHEVVRHFYVYFGLYFVSLIEKNAIGYELDSRTLSMLLSAGLIIYIYYLIRDKVFETLARPLFQKMIYRFLAFLILILFISIGADFYGATQLSTRITGGTFSIIHASLIFYTLTIILTGYIIIILRRRISTASNMVEKFSKRVERMTVILIKIGMFLWWFKIVTKVTGTHVYLVAFANDLLAYSWTIATTTVSVQSIFDFIIIIIGTWFVARLINTILQVEVFARFSLPRGFPTAITTVLNYLIVISGTIIALSSLGITPAQFTLVFGALGVGIGFGLRNIIANFVSGIIMVFERPVQIGDTIEINKTMGNVLGIGARSSTIKTFDGSEVIIPNADFIAKEITNWTLSDERRRKVLVFKVDFDSDIDEVMAIMKKIAIEHPNVLQDPEPLSAFLGFGDYYLEFKLYFWLTENLIGAQSDIAIGIYKELKNAGVKMPLPKQEFLTKKSEELE
ncbi:MAG: mechanosensitive ion channel [Campylobacterota bacterium]|nr:mechanosensitive ion channel [Campylobacterota bacterium]